MLLKTRSGRSIELPSEEDEALINAGIAADPDTVEMGDDFFKRARPATRRGDWLVALTGQAKRKA